MKLSEKIATATTLHDKLEWQGHAQSLEEENEILKRQLHRVRKDAQETLASYDSFSGEWSQAQATLRSLDSENQ